MKKIHSLSFSLPRGDQTADSTREEASCRKKHNAFRKHLYPPSYWDGDAGDATQLKYSIKICLNKSYKHH